MLMKFDQDLKDNIIKSVIPYKLTIEEFWGIMKNLTDSPIRNKNKNCYIVFLGDIENNSYLISFERGKRMKLKKDDLQKYIKYPIKDIKDYYRYKKHNLIIT